MSAEPTPASLILDPASSSPRRAQHRARDLTIFKKVVLENFTHQEVAHVYKLDKSRVTQIVARVRRQLAEADRDDPSIENPLARQRLENRLEQMRLEFLLSKTTDALQKQPTSLKTTKEGNNQQNGQTNTWNVAITRELPPTAQIINAYLRVSRRLGELRDSQIQDNPIPSHLQQDELLKAIRDALVSWVTASAQFAQQPSDEFKEAIQDFRHILGRYLTRRRNGLAPAHCWDVETLQEMRAKRAKDDAAKAASANRSTPPATNQPTPPTSSGNATAATSSNNSSPPQELTNSHLKMTNAHPPLTAPPIVLQLPTSIPSST